MMRATTMGLSWLRPVGWGLVALALLTPLIAMQFTHEVAWTASDFLLAAVLLVGAGVLIELAVRRVRNRTGAALVAGAVVLAVLLIWADGAQWGFSRSPAATPSRRAGCPDRRPWPGG